MSSKERIRVIYISSCSHSGSTLLDMLLGERSAIVSVGEVANLSYYAQCRVKEKKSPGRFGYACTCGAESIHSCDFWQAVEDRLKKDVSRVLVDLDINSQDQSRFDIDNYALFSAVKAVSQASVIVDSSKSADRLRRLLKVDGLDVYPVHLVRDPRGQVCSIRKKRGTIVTRSLRYNRVNYAISRILSRRIPHYQLSYEYLCSNSEEAIARIMHFVGLSMESGLLCWNRKIRHNLGGNRMRMSDDTSIHLDEKWRQELSAFEKCIIRIVTVPVSLYLWCRR